MSVTDKRVTRDMRQTLLNMHNDLKTIKNTVEGCNDMWLSDVRKLEAIIHYLHSEFEFRPRDKYDSYYSDWVFAEDVKEEGDDD